MPTIPHASPGRSFSTLRNSSSSAKKPVPPQERATLANSEEDDFAQHREKVFGKISPIDFAEQQMGNMFEHERHTHFLMNIRSYPFTFEEKTEIARRYPLAVSGYVHRFYFDNSEQKVAFLGSLLNSLRSDLMEVPFVSLYEKLGIKNQADIVKLGDSIASTPYIFPFNEHVKVDEPGKRYEWASQAASLQSSNFLSLSGVFKLNNADLKPLLLAAINQHDLSSHARLANISGMSEEDKTELLIALAKRDPSTGVAHIADFPEIGEKNRASIARAVAENDPLIIMQEVSSFRIEDKRVLQEFFISHFKQFVETSLQHIEDSGVDDNQKNEFMDHVVKYSFNYIDENFNESSQYPDFKKNAEKLGIQFPVIADILDEITNITAPAVRDNLQKWVLDAHVRLYNPSHSESVKQNLNTSLAGIYQYRQPEMRFVLTRLLARATMPGSVEPDSIQQFEEICRALTRPHTRIFRPLLCALGRKVPSEKAMTGKYASLLSRDEMKDKKRQRNVMSGFIALLSSPRLSPENKQHILQAITPAQPGRQSVKEFAKNMQNLADFIPLTGAERTGNKALNALLKINSGDDLNNAFGQLFLLVLGRTENGEINDKEATRFINKFQEVTKDFRRPDALLKYCSRLYVGLPEDDGREEVFNVINQFIDNVLLTGSLHKAKFPDNQWVNNISDAYRNEKNNIANSQHLTNVNNINPEITRLFLNSEIEIKQVFDRYGVVDRDINIQEKLHQFLMQDVARSENQFPVVFRMLKEGLPPDINTNVYQSDINYVEELLLSLLNKDSTLETQKVTISNLISVSSLEHDYPELLMTLHELKLSLLSQIFPEKSHSDLTLKFTHNVENHLLCGTEVIGSCLAIDGDAFYNRALMGLVVQGKNRIITLHSADNTIQARCIIRLGMDKVSNQLALQLEKTYDNPAAPANTSKVFGEFAREFAKKLGGIPILTTFTSYGRFEPYPNKISFDEDRTWAEYIDSGRQGLVSSREGFSIENLFQLK